MIDEPLYPLPEPDPRYESRHPERPPPTRIPSAGRPRLPVPMSDFVESVCLGFLFLVGFPLAAAVVVVLSPFALVGWTVKRLGLVDRSAR